MRLHVHGGEHPLRTDLDTDAAIRLADDLLDVLGGGGSIDDGSVFTLVTRLLLAKLHDEHTTLPGQPYQFQVLPDETFTGTLNRITGLLRECVCQRLGVSRADAIRWTVRPSEVGTDGQLRHAVEQLAGYHFTRIAAEQTGVDLVGGFYERVVRTAAKQSRGQFFTPPAVTRFCADASGVGDLAAERHQLGQPPPLVVDPSAGSGAFLVSAARAVHQSVPSPVNGDGAVRPAAVFVGHEINADLGLAAQVNLLLHGTSSGTVLAGATQGDGLAAFTSYRYPPDVPAGTTRVDGYPKPVIAAFDLVLTNPPFAAKHSAGDRDRYQGILTCAGRTSRSEDLFVERWWQLLKPGGRLCAVVPDSLLDSRGNDHGRDLLLRGFTVRAVVSLPEHTFAPHTVTKTSVLFAQKLPHRTFTVNQERPVPSIFEQHPPFTVATARHLGYKRTTRNEHPSERNDLPALLDQLRQADLWR